MSDNKNNKGKASNAISGSLKDTEKRRKQIFKPILDNPYTQTKLWPFIAPEVSSAILEHLGQILSNLGSYNELLAESKASDKPKIRNQTPEIRKQITIGFNSTIGALEAQASKHRQRISNTTGSKKRKHDTDTDPYIKYVFVAKYDVTPAMLTNPFPVLAYTSSKSAVDRVKLIQLPRGSMSRLSSILKIENTCILGLSNDIDTARALYEILESDVKDVEVPWLNGLFPESVPENSLFRKPAVKFLSTSAPIMSKKNDQKAKNKRQKEINKSKQSAETTDTKE